MLQSQTPTDGSELDSDVPDKQQPDFSHQQTLVCFLSCLVRYHRTHMRNYLMPLEFEAVGSVLVSGLLDGSGCILKETLHIRQLGTEAGQDLPNRWQTAVCVHQLLFQLTDTA